MVPQRLRALKPFSSLPKAFPFVKIKVVMSLKEYLFSLGLGSLLCFVICGLTVINFDPKTNNVLPLIFFYLSLFMGILGGFSFVAIWIKKTVLKNEEIVFRQIKKIFKQALVFSLLTVFIFYLGHLGLLNWLTFLLIVFFYLIFEGIIFTRKEKNDIFYV